MTTENSRTPEANIARAAKRPEADPVITKGATTCATPESIERFRMIACLQALKLEATTGMTMHRGISVLKVAQRDYGVKAKTKAKAYEELRALMVSRGIIEDR